MTDYYEYKLLYMDDCLMISPKEVLYCLGKYFLLKYD